jgi:TRAP-type C4-dicarboxylate transport system permease small subunit
MTLINQVLAEDVSLSTLPNPAPKIPLTSKITELFTKGGFDLINFIFIIIGLIFFANLVMAGWEYMMSSGDPKKVTAATTRVINGLIGLIMAVAAFVVVRLITNVLGLGNLI